MLPPTKRNIVNFTHNHLRKRDIGTLFLIVQSPKKRKRGAHMIRDSMQTPNVMIMKDE